MSDGRDLNIMGAVIRNALEEFPGELDRITFAESDATTIRLMRNASLQAIIDELRAGDMTSHSAAFASVRVNRICEQLLFMVGRTYTEVPF